MSGYEHHEKIHLFITAAREIVNIKHCVALSVPSLRNSRTIDSRPNMLYLGEQDQHRTASVHEVSPFQLPPICPVLSARQNDAIIRCKQAVNVTSVLISFRKRSKGHDLDSCAVSVYLVRQS